MQKINITDLRNANSVLLNESRRSRERESLLKTGEQNAEVVWNRFTKRYGHLFTTAFGEDPNQEWIECLARVDRNSINRAIAETRDLYPRFPPNAAEFKAVCDGRDPNARDEEGNDASWQHKRIEAANRECESTKMLRKIRDRNAAKAAYKKLSNGKKLSEVLGL